MECRLSYEYKPPDELLACRGLQSAGDLRDTYRVHGKTSVPGTVTAKEMYGADGWTLHHLTDPFGRTGVADGVWGITPMDGPWMTFPVYEHFLFHRAIRHSLRTEHIRLMKGSAEFVLGLSHGVTGRISCYKSIAFSGK